MSAGIAVSLGDGYRLSAVLRDVSGPAQRGGRHGAGVDWDPERRRGDHARAWPAVGEVVPVVLGVSHPATP